MTEYQQQSYVFFIMLNSDQFLKFFITLRNWQEIVVQVCEIHSYKTLLNSHEQVLISHECIAKRVEDLKTTKWKDVTETFNSNISDEDYYCLNVVKQSSPLLFEIAVSEWEVSLNLLSLIEEVAVECELL